MYKAPLRLTTAVILCPSSLTKGLSGIIHFLSLRYLPFKVKRWPGTKFSRNPLPAKLIFHTAGYEFVSAALHETKTTCVHLMQTRRVDASDQSPVACLLCLAVWGAMKNDSEEGDRETHWGFLVGLRALNLIFSFWLDPRWPLADLATTKRPKGRRWKEGWSKQTRERAWPLLLFAAAAAANLGFPSRTSSLSILCGQIMSFPALSWRQQTICCSFCDKKKFDAVGVQDLWSSAWLKYFAFQSLLPSGCGIKIKSLQLLQKSYTI